MRDEHVRAHGGLVRCGACRGIFDARAHLIEGALAPLDAFEQPAGALSPQTIIAGMPAMGGEPASARAPEAPKASEPATAQVTANTYASANKVAATPYASPISYSARNRDSNQSDAAIHNVDAKPVASDQSTTAAHAEIASPATGAQDGKRYRWRAQSRPLRTWQKVAYCVLCIVALAALLLQSAYWFRDEIASRAPSAQPILASLCKPVGCRVGPPKRPSELGFTSTELAADPAHKGLLIFSATLHNSGNYAIAYPSLVLTLDGTNGEPLARRVFSPEQYLPANANLQRGLEGGGDTEIKLYLDASPAMPVGFKADYAYL